jgi:hypothetical protein
LLSPKQNDTDKILLYNGEEIPITYTHGMYHASIEGVNFCGETCSGLYRAISSLHSASFNRYTTPVLKNPVSELIRIIKGIHTLDEKQKARDELTKLSPDSPILKEIKQRSVLGSKYPDTVFQCIVRYTGKPDMSYMTLEEIAEYTPDVMMRQKLLTRVAEVFDCLTPETY